MPVLSGKKRNGPSSGHDFDRIKEQSWGSGHGKINRRSDVFSSDYIYIYREDNADDDLIDNEIGINKNYCRIHDMDWCNNEKNEHHSFERHIDNISDDLIEIINPDGSIMFENLQDLLFGEDD